MAGKLKLEVRPLDLRGVIEAALDVVRPAARAKGILLRSRLDGSSKSFSGSRFEPFTPHHPKKRNERRRVNS
jgi:hypothetical protein